MRRVPTVSVLLVFLCLAATATLSGSPGPEHWHPLAGALQGETVRVEAVSPARDGLDLMITVPGLYAFPIETAEGRRGAVVIPGCGVAGAVGTPRLPVLRKLIEVPAGATVRLDLSVPSRTSLSLEDLGLETPLVPVQPPVPKIPGAADRIEFIQDEATYRSDRFLPEEETAIGHRAVIRGREVVLLEVHPVRYNPAAGVVEVWSHATLSVRFDDMPEAAPGEEKDRLSSPSLDPWLDRTVLGGDDSTPASGRGEAGGTASGAEGMLVVVHDDFAAAIDPLVDWKRKTGFRVEVLTTSSIAPSPTDVDVKNAIQQRYDTWSDPSLGFVLLVGDTDFTPIHTGDGGGNSQVTDNWYACLDGPDYLPDLAVARISTRSSAETADVVDKLLTYERATFADDTWAKKAGFIGTSDSGYIGMIEGTHDDCINTYYTPNDFLPTSWSHGGASCDRHYNSYDADTSEISASIDEGRTVINYSGHGSSTSWQGPTSHGGYDQEDVRANTNDGMYPFVISNACVTGTLANQECFGETWQKQPNGGSIGFWGASNNSYWDEDDVLQRAVHDNIFPMDETPPLGVIVNESKMDLYAHYGDTSSVRYYFDMYNLLSEPSLSLWTRRPMDASVSYDDAHPVGEPSFVVTVTDQGGPVEGALVAIRKGDEGVFEAGYTDAAGEITLLMDPAPQNVGTMQVTMTKHDYRPHEGSTEVISPDSPWLLHRSHTVDDAAGGDGDGSANPGETVVLAVTVENVGEQPGTALAGVLSTTTPEWCTVTDLDASFPDLLPDETGTTLPDHFSFLVDPGTPDGAKLDFELDWSASDGSTGTTRFSEMVVSPVLEFGDYSVDDAAQGNDDGWLDPGETVGLRIRLDNGGTGDARDISASLSCDSEYVTVSDSEADYEDVPSAAAGWSLDPHYTVSADPGAPAPFWTTCTLDISANYGYRAIDTFRLPISGRGEVLVVDDSSGPNAGLLADLLGDLAYATSTVAAADTDPASWWEYNFVVWSAGENTGSVSDPALRRSLEEFVLGGGRVVMEGGDLCRNHFDSDPAFVDTVLAMAGHYADPASNLLRYDAGHPISSFPNALPEEIPLEYRGAGSGDACSAAAGAVGVWDWIGHSGRFSVVARDDDADPDNGGQQVTLAFSMDAVESEAERLDLMENVSQWVICSGGPHVLYHSHAVDDSVAGNADGVIDPGETVSISVGLRNTGMGWARSITARLSSDLPEYVSFADNYVTFPDIPDGGGVTFSDPPHYTVLFAPETPCGTKVEFSLEIEGDGFRYVRHFDLKIGAGGGGESTFHSTDTPMAIPDPGVAESVIDVNDLFGVGDVTVSVNLQHSNINRVQVRLLSPEGTEVVLHDRSGSGMDLVETYDTTKQPDGPGEMSWYDTEVAMGDWTLRVEDFTHDLLSGGLNSWSLWFLRGNLCTEYDCPYPVPGPVGDTLRIESLGGSDIRLEWAGIPDADSYVVWRSASPDMAEAETVGNSGTGATWYEEIGAKNDAVLYYYVVRGADACHRSGE